MRVARTKHHIADANSDEYFLCRQIAGRLALEQEDRSVVLESGNNSVQTIRRCRLAAATVVTALAPGPGADDVGNAATPDLPSGNILGLHQLRSGIALICGLGLLPAAHFHLVPQIFCYLAAYPVIWLGTVRFPPFARPVTQLIRSAVGEGWSGYQIGRDRLAGDGSSRLPLLHLIEKPALSYKKAPVKADTVG
jgi:hypothetical protein